MKELVRTHLTASTHHEDLSNDDVEQILSQAVIEFDPAVTQLQVT